MDKVVLRVVEVLSLPMNFCLMIRDIMKGYFPRSLAIRRLRKTMRSPETFQEKILYKIAWDRRDILRIFADKFAVREYVAKRIGFEYLVPLVAVMDEYDPHILRQLPRNYVMKPSNYSGVVLIVSETAPLGSKLPHLWKLNVNQKYIVHPDSIDLIRFRLLLKRWMTLDYYLKRGQYPEWAYKDIKGRILFEELIDDGTGIASDYRFFIFNGKCHYIEVDTSWNETPTRTMFDRNWNQQYVKLRYPAKTPEAKKPENLSKAIELAEKLAQETDHVRVDLYLRGSQILFGELTNYHTGGKQYFEPEEFNLTFSQSWRPELFY